MVIYRAERDARRFAGPGLGDIAGGRPDLGPDRREFVVREVDCRATEGSICRFVVRQLPTELDAG